MNRNEEYKILLDELDVASIDTQYMVECAGQRMSRQKKGTRRVFIFMASVITCFIMFVTLVNLFPAFAKACSKVPVIKDLVRAVEFSPSLTEAVKHDYMQTINLEQEQNGIKIRIEYVIVDRKQLNVFYTLSSESLGKYEITPKLLKSDGSCFGGYAMHTGGIVRADGELQRITIDVMDNDVPQEVQIVFHVKGVGEIPEKLDVPQYGATFTFSLNLNQKDIITGDCFEVNKDIMLGEQHFKITKVEIYPTNMLLRFSEDENNTAYLSSLEFYITNEKNQRFDCTTSGIVAYGEEGTTSMLSHRLESAFFSESKELTLHITGVWWQEKDKERVRIDLENGTTGELPQGVRKKSIKKVQGGYQLTWIVGEIDGLNPQIPFRMTYQKEDKKDYPIDSFSSNTCECWNEKEGTYSVDDTKSELSFVIPESDNSIVYLLPSYTNMEIFKEEMVIQIK